ncbi:MAG: flagellar biosynthesis protein FlhA [Desulfurispora sp.]|uniref:flagellar biosynthesis protein FlhA n=1 Tax=Desulfurispora sp. TaxID=3014275 RepID=UPI00404B6D68
MATPATSRWLGQVKKNTDLAVAALVLLIILMIIIPLSPRLLDVLLVLSMTLGLVILLITMFTTEPLQFAVFPTLLLVTTLYRLALNISSTRLILGQAEAGRVIESFGTFVVGGNYIVGFIVFLIITVIQFVVITSGAGRVAEVAARFTLDAMPGKQMSIDADFNAGLISEAEARERRKRLQREADFFGAMDGASKFVRGDAIAGIVITLINIVGGICIGLLQMGMDLSGALHTYTILTIGDGLVTQIPALLISTSSGILVTRATSDASFGTDVVGQFGRFPKILFLVAGILLLLGLVPAMPNLLFLTAGGLAGWAGYSLQKSRQRAEAEQREQEASRQLQAQKRSEPENVITYFQVDPLQIEIGYNLIPLTDEENGGDLLPRLSLVRRQCAAELGIYVRPIRIRDNLQLPPNSYVFKLRGEEAANGELLVDHYLVMDPMHMGGEIPGIPTQEPTFGLPAWWVPAARRNEMEMRGLTVVDCATVLVTHLTEFIKVHAHELLGRQETRELLDAVKEKDPAVLEDLPPELISLGDIQKVLQALLRERLPVRDLVAILEALADGVRLSREQDFLIEHVRQQLARTICRQYATAQNKISVLTLHPGWEQLIADAVQLTQWGKYPVLDAVLSRQLIEQVQIAVEKVLQQGTQPVLICTPQIRLPLRRFLERYLPQVAVISLNEVVPGYEVEVVGTVVKP